MAATYITADRVKELSEFPVVTSKSDEKLDVYVRRAHALANTFGPFVTEDDLDAEQGEQFLSDMELALFSVIERMVLANPSVAAAAAGYTSETIGKWSYSRAQGGHNTGQAVASEIITEETLAIFKLWRLVDVTEDDFRVERTDVFRGTLIHDQIDTGRRVLVDEDFDELAPSYLQDTHGTRY